jgi:GTP-binding protein
LRHIERTKVLVHFIDSRTDDIERDYKVIMGELKNYQVDLTKKPMIVALSKTDTIEPKEVIKKTKILEKVVTKGTPTFAISAVSRAQVTELLVAARELALKKTASKKIAKPLSDLHVYELSATDDDFAVEKMDGYFLVTGAKIERFAKRTNFGDEYGEDRLKDIMRKMFITTELTRSGA